MLLLFVLLLRAAVGEPVTEAASGLLRYLPLLLVLLRRWGDGLCRAARRRFLGSAVRWAVAADVAAVRRLADGADRPPGAAREMAMSLDWHAALRAVLHHPLFRRRHPPAVVYQGALAAYERTLDVPAPVLVSALAVRWSASRCRPG